MWPFRNKRNKELIESHQAIIDATKKLKDVESRTNEVLEVSGALRTIRERNHFAEQLRTIMQGG